jgi:hypothetical protein
MTQVKVAINHPHPEHRNELILRVQLAAEVIRRTPVTVVGAGGVEENVVFRSTGRNLPAACWHLWLSP